MATRAVADSGIVGTSSGLVFSVAPGFSAVIQKLSLFNNSSSSARTCTVHVLQESGDTPVQANKFFEQAISSKETKQINISSMNVGPGGSVHITVGSGSDVTWHLSATLKTQNADATGSGGGF